MIGPRGPDRKRVRSHNFPSLPAGGTALLLGKRVERDALLFAAEDKPSFIALESAAAVVTDLNATRVVGVEEVLIVVLLRLPLGERKEHASKHGAEDDEERIVIDTKRLSGSLTAGLVARKGTEVECAVHPDNGFCVRRLRVHSDGRGGQR